MKLILQRVVSSSVWVGSTEISRISKGISVLFGAEKGDDKKKIVYLAERVANLRIFPDENGKMNRSCLDIRGEILVVPQFTLVGDCSRGRRPGFDRAAEPVIAETLYRFFIRKLEQTGLKVETGEFGIDMLVDIQNEGPVTLILER